MIDVQAIICDADGTLLDSRTSALRAWEQWSKEFNVQLPETTDVDNLPNRNMVAHLVNPELISDAWRRIDSLEVAEAHSVTTFPGVSELLNDIAHERLAVVSSSTKIVTLSRFAAAELHYNGVLITVEEMEFNEPDPYLYLTAANRLGVKPNDCLVLASGSAGVTAALAGGFKCIAVERYTANYQPIPEPQRNYDQELQDRYYFVDYPARHNLQEPQQRHPEAIIQDLRQMTVKHDCGRLHISVGDEPQLATTGGAKYWNR